MMKISQLTRARRRGAGGYDLVVVDAPATGHALGLLRSPQTFGAIARVGPIAGQTNKVQELLSDPAQSAYLGVALATDMAVTEALELQDALDVQLSRPLEAVIVNGLLPRRFNSAEMEKIEGLLGDRAERAALTHAAARAAVAVHERARLQHNQVGRLRRRNFEVLGIPFVWGARLDLAAVQGIATRLAQKL
jgi:anion-transporting  ArsA/GET3 family ATPase